MEKDGGPGEGPRKGAGGLRGKGGEKPEDSASQTLVQRTEDRGGRGHWAGKEKRAEKERERGERGERGSHTLLPWTFISDTKEEVRPLREAGAGRPSCIMYFSFCLFSSSVHFLAGVLSPAIAASGLGA